MYVVDAHQDIAFNAVCFDRDYRVSALKKRRQEVGSSYRPLEGTPTLGLPEALVGRVAVVFATLYVAPASPHEPLPAHLTYTDAESARRLAMQQVDYYQRITDEDDRLALVHTAGELDDVLATWEPDKTIIERKQGMVILMEGADPIIEPEQFEEWHGLGVRIVGPAWRSTRYAGGTGEPGPLTALGRELLDVMAGFNTLLDLSHMAEQAYLEALDIYEGPVFASHSNPRYFCDSDRHLSDDMIRRLAERDGVMGVVMANYFLRQNWGRTDNKQDVTLADVVNVIDYVCQMTGSAAHVGLGSDFDGGFGVESIPAEFDTVADLLQIADVLRARGYAEDDINAIMSGNMLRKLRQTLPA
jgi:membrane dipeptidase